MAMSLVLRNACRSNAINLLKNARATPLKTFTSSALLAPKKELQLNLVKSVQRNISVTAPKLSSGGSHSGIWVAERGIAVAFLGVIPAAFLFPSQALDALLATSIVMHQHWGLEAMVIDYVRPVIFGNVVPKVAQGALFLISAATLGGLFYFIYNDIGIAKAVKQLWSIKAASSSEN
ncbi:succinate dehydrogenase [ubiquinone] cytochrome b small subunit, mitochondrial [Eupeodes corollae]|uniref:succinate dehydrogenase [ubiquinone] cytochrome b small subunit, mitochondrial n=1 Tax=Eupeodes corollae TaxID=290404 RepID=UPI00248F88F9|nr:succinate dehydrogenase [ubiquinone] cytochrome b small subunit, mitochondrial [Eupeodes corollae]XP_055903520.1 succinate dehydrogenase [ubiquinone] cytochrome b small subunit, mitochondrial [Eupeodes corollae]